ncbi:MAG: murein L,D-transpeptidase [Acidobacteria bacterium]|nr:murein L,D-transpeptidase [Acidobacteriota bacterium]
MAALLWSSTLPSSPRSREVINRVSPSLRNSLNQKRLKLGAPIFIRIFKQSRYLEVWLCDGREFVLFKSYPICTYSGQLGPKIRAGDGQSPEGFYFVTPQRMNPSSQFHLSFDIGFPNAYDRAHGRTGSYLMVHGDCVSIGCYAMTDAGIEEIYTLADAAFRNGQSDFKVHIFPFRMTVENLNVHRDSKWFEFWKNLKEGYDWFERERRPPSIDVAKFRYVFK